MIEFVLGNRKLRLHPDGIMYVRALNKFGEETKSGRIWKEVTFNTSKTTGYIRCDINIDGIKKGFSQHRLVYYAHNQDWDIFDSSPDNSIDHINHKKDDNCIENLRPVTHQQNMWNTNAKGCSWDKRRNKWQSRITINGKKTHIGMFENEEDAHNAYTKRKSELHLI